MKLFIAAKSLGEPEDFAHTVPGELGEAVEAFLTADVEAELDRQIVEGHTRMPQGGEHDRDEWGDLGRMVDSLSIETFRALDAEEREAGLDPW